MSVSNTVVNTTYDGNGVTTSFPIAFALISNDQVRVSQYDTVLAITTILVEGTDYTITGGNPGSAILMGTAPAADQQINVYRSTDLEQAYDFLETGAFKADDFETALDVMVMMIQELQYAIANVTPAVGDGSYTILPAADMAAAATIPVTTNQRMIKYVGGDGAPQILSLTIPVQAGSSDGQELRLIGTSDDNTLTMVDQAGSNVSLNGTITLGLRSVLDLVWNNTDLIWIESGRKV